MTPGVAFDTLLAQLRGEGFTIGIDRILQIERLLQGPGSRVAPNRLKQLLGPLLANTAEQQERFEVLYDQFFGFAPTPEQNKPVKPDPEAPSWWKWILAGLAVVALSALLAVRAMYPEPVPPRPPGAPRPPCAVPCNPYLAPSAVPRATSRLSGQPVELDGSGSTFQYGGPLTHRWTLSARPPGSAAVLQNADRASASFLADKPGNYAVTLTVHDGLAASPPAPLPVGVYETPHPPPPEVTPRWQREAIVTTIDFAYAHWLLPPIALAVLYLLRRYWERRAILDRVRQEDLGRAHDFRTLELPEDPSVEADIRAAVRTLRRPFLGAPRLHVGKSVLATVRSAGFPRLVFEPTRRRAEYVILVDKLAKRDHQSELFQQTVRALHQSGLSIQAYLYAGDPRVCWPMELPGVARRASSIPLTDLVHKASGARLLLFGDASQLLYEQTAELQPWTEIFRQWPERGIFTPKRADEWSDAEAALAREFQLIPAGPDSFKLFFDTRKPDSEFGFFEPAWDYATAADLRANLEPEVYRWLSACALYPRLEWILTIRLGRALGTYTDESRLLRLIRLPWFRQGEMPLELQQDLVEAMTKERTVAAARAALRKLLEEAREVAKDASGAGAAGFEIAVQRLGLTPLERRALRRDMAVARQPLRGDKGWLPELSAGLSLMLFGGSKWMALRSRWLLALLGAFVLLGMVGFLGVQGFGEIRQKYAGPSVAEVRGEESRVTLREPVRLIRFSGDGQRMVVAGASGEVLVADASGRRLATVSYPGSPSEIVAGYDGATVVIGGSAGVYTSRLSAGGGEARAWVRGELIGNTSARDELIAVKEDGGTVRLYFQNTRRFDLPADTRKLLWSGPGQGWIETARGVRPFETKGTGLQLGEPLSGSQTMLAGLNSSGMPVLAPRDGKSGPFTTKGFARAFANGAPAHQLVAGDFFVWNTDSKSSLYQNEIEIDALDNDAGERHAFASPVTALGYDPISRRIAVGLWSGRIEFLPAQFAKVRVNPKDGLPYSYISPGKFPMGCSKGDLECNSTDEGKTPHDVEITRGFWLGQTEVTQAAYKKVTGKDPSIFKGADRPVENVSWDEASAFCTQAGLRLPAEAEWEYAARAGNADARYGPIDRIAWYDKTSSRGTQPVAGKLPNAWGLYDMLGNVFEWVADWYDAGYYDQKVGRDPKGPSKGDGRAMRGGSWSVDSQNARASYRLGYDPSDRNGGIGFRCAGELP